MKRLIDSSIGRPWRYGLRAVVLLAGLAPLAVAAGPAETLPINKGTVVRLPHATDHVNAAVGSETIADIDLIDPTHLFIRGKAVGSTNVVLCAKNDCYRTLSFEITPDLEALRAKLHEIFPGEQPKVYASQGSIILTGQVSSLEKANGILQIAKTFAQKAGGSKGGQTAPSGGQAGSPVISINSMTQPQGGQQNQADEGVINLMQVGGPQQVMLGVTVAEMSTKLARRLKVDFTAFGGNLGGDFSAGTFSGIDLIERLAQIINAGGIPAASAVSPAALFLRFAGTDATVRTFINAAKENGLAKVLAEPNLTTISGQDAEFVSGGEFPVPVPQTIQLAGAGGGITVIFKEFGVILKFLPVVLDTRRISLKLNISVSELSEENKVIIPAGGTGQSFAIPSLTKRSAASSLELDNGQTLGIAGLISDRTRNNITKFPGLGDIPVLGQLFTSQEYLRNETELVIFVTPHLAKPINPSRIRLPTDDYVEPSDAEFYWMGRTEGLTRPPARPYAGQSNYGGLRGHFGQTLQ